jgi:hypothetical protein
MTSEYFETSSKKGRGRARRSIEIIEAARTIAEQGQPISVRGVAYKLFNRKLIPSMAKKDTQRVSRLLKEAREEGIIDWDWIVDEAREFERKPQWDDPDHFARSLTRQYRRDFWNQQPVRCEIWSEKGTLRGVLDRALCRGLGPERHVHVRARPARPIREVRRRTRPDRAYCSDAGTVERTSVVPGNR